MSLDHPIIFGSLTAALRLFHILEQENSDEFAQYVDRLWEQGKKQHDATLFLAVYRFKVEGKTEQIDELLAIIACCILGERVIEGTITPVIGDMQTVDDFETAFRWATSLETLLEAMSVNTRAANDDAAETEGATA